MRREGSYDASVKVGEIAIARHIDADGIGSLDLEIDICYHRAIFLLIVIILRCGIFDQEVSIFLYSFTLIRRDLV